MHRFPFSVSCLFLLVACGDSPSFSGEYGARSKGDGDSAHSDDNPSNLDPKLIGRWRRTISNSVAGTLPRNNMNVATDIFCTLAGDGSFSYGGALTGVASPGFAGTSGSADGSTGEWKAEGSVLFSRTMGQEQWTQLGRYAISGPSLVLYAGDDKQLWERQ